MRRYGRLFRGFRWQLIGFLLVALLQFGLAAPLPFLVKTVFDRAIADERIGLLIGLTLLMLGLQLAHSIVGLAAANWLLRISSEVMLQFRQTVFDRLYSLSIRYHETNPLGDLHDRVVHETERVDAMTRNGFAAAAPSAILAVGILCVLAVINWVLFVITIAFVPVAYAVNRVTRTALRRAIRRLHASVESFSATTLGALRTMRQTRILGAEQQARAGQDVVLGEVAGAAKHHGVMQRSHLSANLVVLAVWAMLILAVGGVFVIDGRMTLGALFSFYAGLALIRHPFDQLTRAVPFIIAGREALGRVFELLDVADSRPYTGTRRLDISGRLSVQDVTFEYEPGAPVLVDASIDVEPGEIVALMGPNGSGKTTLANLMLGFYRPTAGQVVVDGVAYDELDVQYLRRQIGVLTQDPIMVPGTVRDNITYGRPDIPDEELGRAVRLAVAGQLVAELDDGLDTLAYENGPLLSGGELQRVALARALLGRPKVLILDEPSTHLDIAGLTGLLEGLRMIAEAPAMLLITHEQEVALMADATYHFENGRPTRVVGSRSTIR